MLVSVPAPTKSQAAWRAPVLDGLASAPVPRSMKMTSDRWRPGWRAPTPRAVRRRYAVDGTGTRDRLGRADPSEGAGRVRGRRHHRAGPLVPRPVGPGRPAVIARAGPGVRVGERHHHGRARLVPGP